MRVSIFLIAALAASAIAIPNSKFGKLVDSIKNAVDLFSNVICTEQYAPVCGSDFKTYSNACKAQLAGVSVQFEGECSLADPPVYVCGDLYVPVCGSDGKTYANDCFASLAQVTVVAQGECPTPVVEPPGFACAQIYEPVCGSDGVTYSNECMASLAQVSVVAQGECPTPVVEPPSFVCGEIYEPVCGSDGVTYANKCFASLAQAEVAYEGECAVRTVPPPQTESCEWSCGAQGFNPVCGSNGRTYSNACAARCRGATVVSQGMCESDVETRRPRRDNPPPQTESCEWSCGAQGFNPVCGDDGRTYHNACSAGCRGATVVSQGQCNADAVETGAPVDDCICTLEYSPVCGRDGKTYGNKCEARCARVKIAHRGEC